MEWYAWVAWALPLVLSVYSAYRWWREDQHKKATQARWEIKHFQNDAFTLTSRLPYKATGVTLEAGTRFSRPIVDETFLPRAEMTFMPVTHGGFTAGSEILVTWRRPHRKKQLAEILLLPPKGPRSRQG